MLSSIALLFVSGVAGAPSYDIGHVSASWPAPQGTVTAEVYYPAAAAGEGTPLAALPGGHPLVVFGHGYLMPASAYGYLVDALVPLGYVLALPTTGGELFPDHAAFALDLTSTAEALQAESADPTSLFFEGLSGRAAAMGHSMGGGASVLAAAAGSTFTCVANLAAAETQPSAIAAAGSVTQPLLVFSAGDDCVTPPSAHQLPIYAAAASSCKQLVTLTGGTHCQFASESSACNLGELFCGSGLAAATQQSLVVELLVDYLDATLRLDSAAWTRFQAALATTPQVVASVACSPNLTVLQVDAPPASQPGSVTLTGVGLDFVSAATVDGAPVPVLDQSALALTLQAAPSAPGLLPLELTGLFGSLSVPAAVLRAPALDASAATLGQPFAIELFTQTPAAIAVAWSLGAGTPAPVGLIYHTFDLALPFYVLAGGVSDANGRWSLAVTLPSAPALEGLTLALQGYADLPSQASFTNAELRALR